MKQTKKKPKNDSTATNDVGKMKEEIRAQYGENKTITDDNYGQVVSCQVYQWNFRRHKDGGCHCLQGHSFCRPATRRSL